VKAKPAVDRKSHGLRTGCKPAFLDVDYANWHDDRIAAAKRNAAAESRVARPRRLAPRTR